MSKPKRRVGVSVATMTGLAELCGEGIELALTRAGLSCGRVLMAGLDAFAFASYDVLVVASATDGHGELPDSGRELFAALEAGARRAGKDYAVFAPGDRTYSNTFCTTGDRRAAVLDACGARRLTDVERHDASGGTFAEDVAGDWAAELSRTLMSPGNGAYGRDAHCRDKNDEAACAKAGGSRLAMPIRKWGIS